MGAPALCQGKNWKGMPGADACRTCEILWPEKRSSVGFLVLLPVGGKEEWSQILFLTFCNNLIIATKGLCSDL